MQIKQVHLCTAGQAVAGLGWLAGQALHSPDIKHALKHPISGESQRLQLSKYAGSAENRALFSSRL